MLLTSGKDQNTLRHEFSLFRTHSGTCREENHSPGPAYLLLIYGLHFLKLLNEQWTRCLSILWDVGASLCHTFASFPPGTSATFYMCFCDAFFIGRFAAQKLFDDTEGVLDGDNRF